MKHQPAGENEDPRELPTAWSTHRPRPASREAPRKEWVLWVAHHPDNSALGRMAVLSTDKNTPIGRRSDIFEPPALLHPSISRDHCELRACADGVKMRNLSERGTKVNGLARDTAVLVDGDVLWIGRVLLLVRRTVPIVARSPDPAMIGYGAAMASLLESIRVAAAGDQPVLLRGETGTGKEVVAAVIHGQSARRQKPYFQVALNERPEGLIASELFGHAQGAFPGARDHTGIVEHVAGGTLLLDEIAKCSIEVQGRLLRFLEKKEFFRIGDTRLRQADVRVIAASNESLERLRDQGKFLPDLLNRIRGQTISLPPLRNRREDVAPLSHHFLSRWNVDLRIAPELMVCLLRHPWKDNVRELRTVVEVAVAAARAAGEDTLRLAPVVKEKLFPPEDESAPPQGHGGLDEHRRSRSRREVSRTELIELLVRCEGNIKSVAREGRIARSSVYALIEEFDLCPDDYRPPAPRDA